MMRPLGSRKYTAAAVRMVDLPCTPTERVGPVLEAEVADPRKAGVELRVPGLPAEHPDEELGRRQASSHIRLEDERYRSVRTKTGI